MSSPQTAIGARPLAVTQLIVVVSVAGFAVIGHSIFALSSTPHAGGWIAVGLLALVAGSFALRVPGVPANLSISDTFFITSALLFGPAPATLTIALDSLVISWNRTPTVDRMLFNLTSPALSLWVGTQVFFALTQTKPLYDVATPPTAAIIAPLACLALVYYLLNSGLLAAVVALDKGVAVLPLWRRHFTVISLNYFASASAAFVLVVLLKYISVVAAAALLPVLIFFYLAMRSFLGRLEDANTHVAALNRLYLSTVAALSTAIEAKDNVTSDHIHRVQAYAMGLARALAITDPATLEAIEAAALLHDTGKIAVPEHILNKPGRLTPAEFETMKSHVDVGVDILSAIDFPYPVVPIVAAHHENWDGSGYPNRLSGEAIPIGARILSVVDCFDALTSDRPYRPAMSEAAAIAILRQRSGNFYDPAVVDTFERVYRAIAPTAIPQPRLQNVLSRIRRVREAAPAVTIAPDRVHVESTGGDSSEELLAFVSLARLASGTPTFGDIGALASGHLRQVAPGATLALFIVDPIRNAVVVRYTNGPAATELAGMVIGIGERITGWVTANARTMVNADAALDLGGAHGPDVQFAIALPLIADGSPVGVMSLYGPSPFSDDQTRRLAMIAPHLATSVAAAIAADTGMRPGVFAEVSRR